MDSVRLHAAWQGVLNRLKGEIPAAWFQRFIRPLKPVSMSEGTVTILAPGKFITEWVRERFLGNIHAFLADELGEPVELVLVAELRNKPEGLVAEDRVNTSVPVEPRPVVLEVAKFQPNPRFRFDSYVGGQSNRLALAGARAVAQSPGQKYNPLFIYGPSGLGKTHLLHAIARELLQREPNQVVAYVSAQQFAEEFVQALQNNRIDQFRRAQRNVAVWLVDDIQFVAGKDKTSEEIFYTFNYLQSLNKQIVITSDRPPRDLYLMDERLRSRFESGLVADVQMPDTETRCAILLSKAREDGFHLDDEVAMVLAEWVPGNIRTLEGALTKVVAVASVEEMPLTVDLAQRVIETHYRTLVRAKPGFDLIVEIVGKHFNIAVPDIKGISRKAPIVHARHIAVFITREITGDSWKHIGSLFGDRDHTSMMHGYQKISEMMHKDKDLRATVKKLIRDLQP
ncbi:MAG: chromosomal replication initiator protein DnaA [Fimbriimonas sp.]